MVFDIIAEGDGINAVDEWGQTPLMIATQRDSLQIIASLLNARRPKVDVNIAKSVSLFDEISTVFYWAYIATISFFILLNL
jgi:hypothetical protein